MDVIEAANNLAQAISESEVIKELADARANYEKNEELIKKVQEYMVQSAAMKEEMNKGADADADIMRAIRERMNAIGAELNKNDDFIRLTQAQTSADMLLGRVNGILEKAIRGDSSDDDGEEEGCTHDCSHCSGCH